jgi:tripartite-type tricarboxylate transporter receptor subunit TctC
MKTKHPSLLAVLLLLGLGTPPPSASFAQRYPDRPIQLVIPNPAGAIADITARVLAEDLEKTLGQRIIPTNRPGASSVLGIDAVVRGKKDGYTLAYANTSSLIFVPITNPEVVHYNPATDLEPLGFHYWLPPTINVKADSPWKTFGELIDYANRNPGKLRIGTVGIGSISHFAVEMIQAMTDAQFTHVPFKGIHRDRCLGRPCGSQLRCFLQGETPYGHRRDEDSFDHE